MMSPEKTITLMTTPVMPDLRGVGVEQRAARTLAALALRGPVDLVLCRARWVDWAERLRRRAPPEPRPLPAGCRSLTRAPRAEPLPAETALRRAALALPRSAALGACTRALARTLPAGRPRPDVAPRWATRPDHAEQPGHLHAFRLAAAAALPDLGERVRREIDLDDIESEVARDVAALAARAGDHAVAAFYRALSDRLGALEETLLPRFHKAWVCSHADQATLGARFPRLELGVLPNVVDLPAARRGPRAPGPARFLYVGALAYYPNIDALRVLLERVLPRLRATARGPFELHVVGRGAPRWLARRLGADRSVVFHGAVPAMGPHYAAADAVVVPLGAGGGTRIKLLEAFAHEVPVIATATGAFGLDVVADEHFVLADDDESLVARCARFIDDPEHARAIAERAYRYVMTHHHADVFAKRLVAPTSSSPIAGVSL